MTSSSPEFMDTCILLYRLRSISAEWCLIGGLRQVGFVARKHQANSSKNITSKVTIEGFFRYQINVHSRVMYEPLEHKATI